VNGDLQAARAALAPLLPHEWVWRPVPFGPCPRCWWPANTLGPNGSPWHAFCWGNPDPPPSFDQWMRRKVRAGEWQS
jgi:hypothetical protein